MWTVLALVAAGVQYFIVAPTGPDMETVRLLGERVIPAMADVAPLATAGTA